MEKHIRVICCGNPLRGEDAVGLEVFKKLKHMELAENVALIDGGTVGLGLLPLFNDSSKVILVDGVIMDKEPGHVQWFSSEEVIAKSSVKISGHEMDLSQVLRIWHTIKDPNLIVDISVLGISIKNTGLGYNFLSASVMAGVDKATNEISEKIRMESNAQ